MRYAERRAEGVRREELLLRVSAKGLVRGGGAEDLRVVQQHLALAAQDALVGKLVVAQLVGQAQGHAADGREPGLDALDQGLGLGAGVLLGVFQQGLPRHEVRGRAHGHEDQAHHREHQGREPEGDAAPG